jgi:hypothetical protein
VDAPPTGPVRAAWATRRHGLAPGASADDLRRALEGNELASGTLVGTYQR